MNWIQIIFGLYFAFVGAYLSIVLARVLRQNGRVLDRMDEGFKRADETLKRTDEGFKRTDETLRRTDETFKLIAKLIVEENETTRKEILAALGK